MCGILGSAVRHGIVSETALVRGLHALAHRGPDDEGWQVLRSPGPEPVSVFLGNRRLSIQDLSPAGHQPMRDPDTGNWIAFNGEVYNFHDVRVELEAHGARFRSHCDTEVILKAYGAWGPACLDRFRGMFAIAIWDASAQRIFLARDRFGEKPLYYFASGDSLLFGSEIRALLKTGLIAPTLSADGVRDFLAFGAVQDPTTIIDGLRQLPPAHYLTWQSGQVEVRRYWDLSAAADMPHSPERLAPERLIPELREVLLEAVKLRMVSDVPVGLFLSGGIDSSVLAAVLSGAGIRPRTFSIAFREAEYDESQHSRAVASAFQTDHQETVLSQPEVIEAIPSIIDSMDQPSVDGVNTYMVAREARRCGLKVALSGLGGDELFAGYGTFHDVPRMERLEWRMRVLPKTVREWNARLIGAGCVIRHDRAKIEAMVRGDFVHPYFLARMLFTPPQQAALIAPRLSPNGVGRKTQMALLAAAGRVDPINRVSYLEMYSYMSNMLLRDTDTQGMTHSLEIRAPLVDHVLAEYLLKVPGSLKISATPKHLLVRAAGTEVPRSAILRRKQGFTLPFGRWMKQDIRGELDSVLLRSGATDAVLHPAAVRNVWTDFLAGRASWSRPWALYVLLKWCETHLA